MAMDAGGGMGMASGGWIEDLAKDARQDIWNVGAYYQRGKDRQDAVEDAKLAYQRNLDAYGSRYQMTMKDMQAAGLNPLLVASQGVGGVPGAQPASQSSAHIPTVQGSKGGASTFVGSYAQAAQAQASLAQAELTKSVADVNIATADNLRARTETEREQPGRVRAETASLQQQVNESLQRVKTLAATENMQHASAAELVAREAKLRAELPQVKATIDLLVSQKGEIDQRVKAQLPELLATLHRLEASSRVYGLPGKEKEGMVQSSPVMGTISAMIKALSPLIR